MIIPPLAHKRVLVVEDDYLIAMDIVRASTDPADAGYTENVLDYYLGSTKSAGESLQLR